MMFEFTPAPKPQHNRRTKKRKERGLFSQATKQAIFERDEWQCVSCRSYQLESVPHHIVFKSQGGEGTKRNGCAVCRSCHDWAHGKAKGPNGEPHAEGRKWFEKWRDEHLDENGELL